MRTKIIQILNFREKDSGFNNPQPYRVYSIYGLSPTLNVVNGGGHEPKILQNYKMSKNNLPNELKGKKFRIRKLTPKECFRLMGVDDEDIATIQSTGLSNHAQYKLAGNSIVVDVLFHIFRKMFVEIGVDKTDEPQQLSLF